MIYKIRGSRGLAPVDGSPVTFPECDPWVWGYRFGIHVMEDGVNIVSELSTGSIIAQGNTPMGAMNAARRVFSETDRSGFAEKVANAIQRFGPANDADVVQLFVDPALFHACHHLAEAHGCPAWLTEVCPEDDKECAKRDCGDDPPKHRVVRCWLKTLEAHRGVRMCRNCGCTDDAACSEGCSWVEADLCSGC